MISERLETPAFSRPEDKRVEGEPSEEGEIVTIVDGDFKQDPGKEDSVAEHCLRRLGNF